jgi:hypothetical protein
MSRLVGFPFVAVFVSCLVVGATSHAQDTDTTAKTAAVAKAPPGINQAALDKLQKRAEASNSDAVVIYKDGKLVGEWYYGKQQGPIETMSATKSIVNLALHRPQGVLRGDPEDGWQ